MTMFSTVTDCYLLQTHPGKAPETSAPLTNRRWQRPLRRTLHCTRSLAPAEKQLQCAMDHSRKHHIPMRQERAQSIHMPLRWPALDESVAPGGMRLSAGQWLAHKGR